MESNEMNQTTTTTSGSTGSNTPMNPAPADRNAPPAVQPKVFGPLELPSGRTIHFRRPLSSDRQDVMSIVEVNEDSVIMFINTQIEELIRAKCVLKVDGNAAPLNYSRLFEDWTDEDTQFYTLVFSEMFGMTEEKRNKAKEAAAFLLKS